MTMKRRNSKRKAPSWENSVNEIGVRTRAKRKRDLIEDSTNLSEHKIGEMLEDGFHNARYQDNGLVSVSSDSELRLNPRKMLGLKERPSVSGSKMDETHHFKISTDTIDSMDSEAIYAFCNYVEKGMKSCPYLERISCGNGKDAEAEALKRAELDSENQVKVGDSLLKSLAVQKIKSHISSLKCHAVQERKILPEDELEKRKDHTVVEKSCQLCRENKLSLGPIPKYCSSCACRVKDNANYYSSQGEIGSLDYVCSSCYTKSCKKVNIMNGNPLIKSKLIKKKNDEKEEEPWIQCSSCRAWEHQICCLYNDKKYADSKTEYVCIACHLMNNLGYNGTTMPLPTYNTQLGAKDLPGSILSDHLEQRLVRRLQQEREERAKMNNIPLAKVPAVEDLIVRVVSSIDKKAEAKKLIYDILHDETYPPEMPYKSKVILLFQKIDGADVCIFALYVQEFGSECNFPNHRCTYISYLDSVKYFRPQVQTSTGEALRTLVFHELLVGYLDYCKKRGFTTCYIWSSPPLNGNEYIFNSHPEIQKTPKCNKLRQWYHNMLRKAVKENIVTDMTNLYDQFFIRNKGQNTKITAAKLPYFEGDDWSQTAEDILKNLNAKSSAEREDTLMRVLRKRRQEKTSDSNAMDVLLMEELGELIMPMKEDFIIAHLQNICTNCNNIIISGRHWRCNQCAKYHLCERCYGGNGTHITQTFEEHILVKVTNEIPENTIDEDPIVDNSILEDRHDFMEFCQNKQYQFNSLRRAKHSTMMILYHLHNKYLS